MRTSQEWHDISRACKTTQAYSDMYRDAKEEAIGAGYAYMQGRITVQEVQHFLCVTGAYYPFDGFTKTAHLIEKGAALAIKDGTAQAARVQPVQPPATLALCKPRKKRKKQKQETPQEAAMQAASSLL